MHSIPILSVGFNMTYIIYVNSISCIDFLGCNIVAKLDSIRRVLFQLQFGVFHLIYIAPKILDAAPTRDEAYNSGEDTYHEGKVQFFFFFDFVLAS